VGLRSSANSDCKEIEAPAPAYTCSSLRLLQVQLLNAEHNPDVMLLAARAITFLADVLPSSCSSIVRHGAVPVFCARLLTIEYIDLAEQSLQVIHLVSELYLARALQPAPSHLHIHQDAALAAFSGAVLVLLFHTGICVRRQP